VGYAVQNSRWGTSLLLLGVSVLALAGGTTSARAQSPQPIITAPPTFAPPPAFGPPPTTPVATAPTAPVTAPVTAPATVTPTATLPATAPTPRARPGTKTAAPTPPVAPTTAPVTQASAPVPVPTSRSEATALPTTHVTAGINPPVAPNGRMLNPYSEQAETKYIKIPVSSKGCRDARTPGKPYFVEFRSRTAVSFGHTFVLFGKLGDGERFASYKIAGLHPKGDSTNYSMGLWIPVAAETGPSDGDLDEQFMTAHYCVALTEAEYNRLVPFIKQLQADHTTWHGTTYNCNSFGMDVAKFIGLDTPNPNASLPKDLIEKLADLNRHRARDPNAPVDAGQLSSAAQPVRR